MKFEETRLKGAFLIHLEKIEDHRGFFARTWCKKEFQDHGLKSELAQSNVSFNKKKGTLRGLHYQVAPYQEAKLVRCTRGAIYDVIIDLRMHSSTCNQWYGVNLTDESYSLLYVPEGFAHGYQTLKDNTEVAYQSSQFYVSNAERGVRWDDPSVRIEWPETEERIMSSKDQLWPTLA